MAMIITRIIKSIAAYDFRIKKELIVSGFRIKNKLTDIEIVNAIQPSFVSWKLHSSEECYCYGRIPLNCL